MTIAPETTPPLIGSGSQEEVDARVAALIGLGKSRGYLTYDELNERLPDEVVSPDKLDSLLMMIDEMGIKLIDDMDVADFAKGGKGKAKKIQEPDIPIEEAEAEEATLDLNLEAELAEASSKRIDDPVRMYLTQMGEIPLLTREQEIGLAKKIEITRKIFRSKVLESDYCLQAAVEILQQVDEGDLPFDRTMKISTAEDQADKATIGQRIPLNLASVRLMLARATGRIGTGCAPPRLKQGTGRAAPGHSPAAPPRREAAGRALAAHQQASRR